MAALCGCVMVGRGVAVALSVCWGTKARGHKDTAYFFPSSFLWLLSSAHALLPEAVLAGHLHHHHQVMMMVAFRFHIEGELPAGDPAGGEVNVTSAVDIYVEANSGFYGFMLARASFVLSQTTLICQLIPCWA